MVIYLVEGPGGQTEGKSAEGVLNIARTVKCDKFVAQNGVALLGVYGKHQGGKAGNCFQTLDQIFRVGQLLAVDNQTHQHLSGNGAPADIDMPQQTLLGLLVIGGDPIVVYIIYNDLFDQICVLRENQTALVFHDLVCTCPKKAGKHPVFLTGNRVLGLVSVAVAGGCG